MQHSPDSHSEGRQRPQRTHCPRHLIKGQEQMMDFYHMKGMNAKKKKDRNRFFELRLHHFNVAQKLIKRYIRDKDTKF